MRTQRALGVAMVLVAAASEMKFRRRSAELALSGSVDAQIILELAVWAGVVGLVMSANLRGGRVHGTRIHGLGPGSRLVALICVLGIGSALVTGEPLALVRALQFAAMAAIALVAHHRAEADRDVVELWIALRRATVLFAVAASVATLLWPASPPLGSERFQWFEVHEIATAGMLGIAIVMASSAVFGVPDPWLRSPGRWTTYALVLALLLPLLVLTGSRGAMAGTLVGVATVGVLSRHRARRGVAVLLSTILAGLMLLGFGTAAVVEVAVRGQTAAQLLTLTGRTELFGIAYELFLERPWLGYGFLSGREVFLERVPWAGEAHNMFVEVAISLGLVGLLLYVALFVWLSRVAIGAMFERPTVVGTTMRDMAGLLAFVIIAGGVTSGAAGVPGTQWLAVLAMTVVGDRWYRNRRRTAGTRRREGTRRLLRQPRSMTSA